MIQYKLIAAVVVGALLAGCSANGTASPPLGAQIPLQTSSVLQFAVGTANIGQTGTVGLNTVATFRQANGSSATLVNTPAIVGPVGFVVSALAPSGDAGTNHITGAPQNVNPAIANPIVTFAQSGGVFSFGFAPENVGSTGAQAFGRYTEPFYSGSTSTSVNLNYGGGPPAYPFFKDGTFPAAFSGYSQGFAMFNNAPVAGVYTLTDTVATGNAGTFTFTATSTLANLTPLPALAMPVFVKDSLGGGTGTVTVPVDARVVETMVYFLNVTQGTFFAVGPIAGTGAQPFTLPDFLGPCSGAAGTGCQLSATTRMPTIATGNSFRVYAVTYDYPMFEASPPGNVSQTPTINGGAATSSQADLTTSPTATQVY